MELTNAAEAVVALKVPREANAEELHLILEIKDDNPIASMYDYRRIVLRVD